MLHRGFYRGTSELGRLLISPSVPPPPLEETEIRIYLQWYRPALIYFVGWLLLFALLVLLGIYIPHATPTFLEY